MQRINITDWRTSRSLAGAFVLVCVTLMLAVVTIFHEVTMVVPEVAAVSTGLLFFRIRAWRQGPFPFYLIICGGAFAGVEVARYLPLPQIDQIAITLAAILSAILFFKVPAYPALSAGLLPVYLHIVTPPYVVAVIVFMGVPTLFIMVTEHTGFAPGPPISVDLRGTLVIAGTLAVMVVVVWIGNSLFLVLPPLFVAATENATNCKRGTKPVPQLAKLSRTALALLVAIELTILLFVNLDVYFIALITVVVALVGVSALGIDSPPVLALSVIPLVFNRVENIHISYLIIIGVLVSQAVPPLLAWAADLAWANLTLRSRAPATYDIDEISDTMDYDG